MVMIHDSTSTFDSSYSPNERAEMGDTNQWTPSSCVYCEDSGWEFGERNYCSCAEGAKLFRKDGELGRVYVAEFFHPTYSIKEVN